MHFPDFPFVKHFRIHQNNCIKAVRKGGKSVSLTSGDRSTVVKPAYGKPVVCSFVCPYILKILSILIRILFAKSRRIYPDALRLCPVRAGCKGDGCHCKNYISENFHFFSFSIGIFKSLIFPFAISLQATLIFLSPPYIGAHVVRAAEH